jgi:predicted DNA-binding protein (MmcQ/YjbR family)
MHVELVRAICLHNPEVTEDFPFDNDTLVFKVAGKAFALVSLQNPVSVNLKCNPDKAIELRQQYDAVQPGYHMNKKHWNTVFFNQDLSDKEIIELIKHSYDCVVNGLSVAKRNQLLSGT